MPLFTKKTIIVIFLSLFSIALLLQVLFALPNAIKAFRLNLAGIIVADYLSSGWSGIETSPPEGNNNSFWIWSDMPESTINVPSSWTTVWIRLKPTNDGIQVINIIESGHEVSSFTLNPGFHWYQVKIIPGCNGVIVFKYRYTTLQHDNRAIAVAISGLAENKP